MIELDTLASTRKKLIEVITLDGPITAGELATRFELTGAAIRRHLSQLESEGIIEERESPQKARTRGRPRKEFVLAAHSAPQASPECEDLALLALKELEAQGGSEALIRLARSRTDEWERRFNQMLATEEQIAPVTPARRVALVIELLKELGYAASLRPVTVSVNPSSKAKENKAITLTTVQMCQGRCPVQEIAVKHPELCEVETTALSNMLGVPVQRLATRAAGAHVCTTHLTPAMGAAILAETPLSELAAEVQSDLLTEERKP